MGKIFDAFKKTCKQTDKIDSGDTVLCIAMSDNGDGMTHKYANSINDIATLVYNAMLKDPDLLLATAAAVEKIKSNKYTDPNVN